KAEDGIRGGHVTGVQTCALPICLRVEEWERDLLRREVVDRPDQPGEAVIGPQLEHITGLHPHHRADAAERPGVVVPLGSVGDNVQVSRHEPHPRSKYRASSQSVTHVLSKMICSCSAVFSRCSNTKSPKASRAMVD